MDDPLHIIPFPKPRNTPACLHFLINSKNVTTNPPFTNTLPKFVFIKVHISKKTPKKGELSSRSFNRASNTHMDGMYE